MDKGKIEGLAHVYGPDGTLKAELKLFMETSLPEQEVKELMQVLKEDRDGDYPLHRDAEHSR